MLNKVPYTIIKQKPFCCVPASLQMILLRRELETFSQEKIGYALGLAVPDEYTKQFPYARRCRPSSGYGTEVQNPEYSINQFFKQHDLGLQEQYVYPDQIDTSKDLVQTTLDSDNDVIVCFHHMTLYGNGDWGHVSLLESLEDEYAILIDPEQNNEDRKKVKFTDLIKAIQIHGKKNRAGFWLIT